MVRRHNSPYPEQRDPTRTPDGTARPATSPPRRAYRSTTSRKTSGSVSRSRPWCMRRPGRRPGTAQEAVDHQRRFITELLETLRVGLGEYHSQQTALDEKRILMENIVEWAEKMGGSLSDQGRRESVGASAGRGDHRPGQQPPDHIEPPVSG